LGNQHGQDKRRALWPREKTLTTESEEGWYSDPFGLHEARWLSDGHPTKLVRDHGVESYDQVPDGPATQTPMRIEEDPDSTDGTDLLRADGAEAAGAYDSSTAGLSALDAVAQDGAPNFQRLYDGETY
jgi:hypothetical protein